MREACSRGALTRAELRAVVLSGWHSMATRERAEVALPPLGIGVEERALRGDWRDFDRIMARVPDAPPAPGDER